MLNSLFILHVLSPRGLDTKKGEANKFFYKYTRVFHSFNSIHIHRCPCSLYTRKNYLRRFVRRTKLKERKRKHIETHRYVRYDTFDTNSQCQSHSEGFDNSAAHLSSEFCDHSTAWRRRKTSHIGRWKVVGSECIEAKRMNINIGGPASILHLLAAPRSPNLDTLVNVSPGRKGRRIRGFAARSDANRTREDHCFPQPDYARPTSRQIFRSVAPSLIYIYIYTMIHVSGPRYSSGDNGAATDRGRRFRGEIAFHAVLVHPCRRFGLEFEPLPLEVPEKALSTEWKLSSFPDR